MKSEQQPLEALDISHQLRTIMAARGLTVHDLATMAGVSKSTMEKYLAGPSSPRLVAVASISKALEISLDTIVFGEFDAHVELARQLAFKGFANMLNDLKENPELMERFLGAERHSDEFADFVRNLAYEKSGQFSRSFAAERRDTGFGPVLAAL